LCWIFNPSQGEQERKGKREKEEKEKRSS